MTRPQATFLRGDALRVLRTLPSESVNCAVTSPPYWGLYWPIGQPIPYADLPAPPT